MKLRGEMWNGSFQEEDSTVCVHCMNMHESHSSIKKGNNPKKNKERENTGDT